MRPRLTVEHIIHEVAMAYGISTALILSERRARKVVRPRQVAIWLAGELTSLSLPRIGHAFRRDHTTVLYALKVVEDLRAHDRAFAALTDSLRESIELGTQPPLDPQVAKDARALAETMAVDIRRRLRDFAARDPIGFFKAVAEIEGGAACPTA